MTHDYIRRQIERLKPWYHSIAIPTEDGEFETTPGEPYGDSWGNIRRARESIDYNQKDVLDLGTFDGMWAFEAESLGSWFVVATDCNWEARDRVMFCIKALNSTVIPLFNVPVHDLVNRLDTYLKGCNVRWGTCTTGERWLRQKQDPKFDVVQHLGIFYHLRDPLLSLLQCRSVIKDGGQLLLETAYLVHADDSIMQFNPKKWKVYDDPTTFWAPSLPCLTDILEASLFRVEPRSVRCLNGDRIGRVALVATAVPLDQADPKIVAELKNSYRTPGLSL